MNVHEAHIVREEGTVIVFEGILVEDDEELQVVWFGVDHSVAATAAQAAEDGLILFVEPWQLLGRTEAV